MAEGENINENKSKRNITKKKSERLRKILNAEDGKFSIYNL